jgi:uncharacterized protein YyaL (SSP411 family)
MTSSSQPADAYREPAVVRRDGNRLGESSSLYLRQHARNPVDWYAWGDEALERARREDKPIFLSIGYSSCHWCHVMEEDVFENDAVAEYLNRNFVAIKVDREERPDIDAAYMHAVQIITGQGGWPLSAFLTPDLKPFFGGTYFPRDQFLALLHKIVEVFREKRGELQEQGDQLAQRAVALPVLPPEEGAVEIDAALIETAAVQGQANFDRKQGGFQGQQKFPTPCRWRFLLNYYRKSGEEAYARIVARTLEAMASGGIYDHVGGGFHRYTVDNKWTVPHFEKMLYDNAQLACLYLEASVVFERADFLAVATDVLDFLLEELRSPEQAFFSSFDADSEGGEGAFYVWTPDEITLATNPDDGPVLAELLGIAPVGNFGGARNVPTRRVTAAQVAKDRGLDPAATARLFAEQRANLRAYRGRRPAPVRDEKIITAWNALTISAFAQAAMVTGRAHYREAAESAAAFLWEKHRRPDGHLVRASNAGRAAAEGVLDDYVFLADAYLELFQLTGTTDHLERSLALAEIVRREFTAPDGGYYLTREASRAPLGRSVDLFDDVIPSGTSVMLRLSLRLAALTGRRELRDEAVDQLRSFAPLIRRTQLDTAVWFDAALLMLGPLYDVIVAGDPDDERTRELVAAVHRRLSPQAVLATLAANGADERLRELAPAVGGKTALEGRPTAYVCEFGTCREPIGDPDRLVEQLLTGWRR